MTDATEPAREDSGLRVRPYALTGGRTRPGTDLAVESIARSTVAGLGALSRLTLEPKNIVMLCTVPQAIAEISAHLDLPLGVVRVLVADLIEDGFVEVTSPMPSASNPTRPDLKLLERVLDGLQSL